MSKNTQAPDWKTQPWAAQIPADQRETGPHTVWKIKKVAGNTISDGLLCYAGFDNVTQDDVGAFAYIFGVANYATTVAIGGTNPRILRVESNAAERARSKKRYEESTARMNAASQKAESAHTASFIIAPGKESDYAAYRKLSQGDGYSQAVIRWAERWGQAMDDLILKTKISTADVIVEYASSLSYETDTEGCSGAMHGMAASMLAKYWIHGETFRVNYK